MGIQLEQTIASFHEAAMFPEKWPEALDHLADACRSQGASLVSFSGTDDRSLRRWTDRARRERGNIRSVLAPVAVYSRSLDYAVEPYVCKSMSDPRIGRVTPSNVSTHFVPDRAHFSHREIGRDAYYQSFLPGLDLGWHAVAAIHSDLALTLRRGHHLGPYEEAELRAHDGLLGAIRTASRVARIAWHCRFQGQLEAFARSGRGAILLDRNARVLECNALVPGIQGLTVRGGTIHASHTPDEPLLQKALKALSEAGLERAGAAPPVLLNRPWCRTPLLIDGVVHASALRSLHSDAVMLLLLTDLDLRARSDPEVLARLFRLTPKEAELAARLREGESLKDAAARLHISEGHARQRLKVLFEKVGVNRQGELIALLGRVPDRADGATGS